jgi:hypothetical protein
MSALAGCGTKSSQQRLNSCQSTKQQRTQFALCFIKDVRNSKRHKSLYLLQKKSGYGYPATRMETAKQKKPEILRYSRATLHKTVTTKLFWEYQTLQYRNERLFIISTNSKRC